jgi:phosphatidylglycerol:prolipoprotein diacylglycerol transferase
MTIFEITLFGIKIAPSYYWLMYAIGFLSWYYIIKKRKIIDNKLIDDLLLYIILWVVLGWRIWYILFYNLDFFINNPLDIFKVWEWWMSFHWWAIGVIISVYLFSKKYKYSFLNLIDHLVTVIPIWLWLWRIWNYLNKELLWFSNYYWPLSVNWRFPSPLIEMFLEWIVLFIILNIAIKNKKFNWQIWALFLIYYWSFRILVEIFFREPDAHIWYILWYFTMWEILSLPMILIWIYYYFKLSKNAK